MKTAVIFGVSGMCGSYLSDLLISKDYKVIGITRKFSNNNNWRIEHLFSEKNFSTLEVDLTDYDDLMRLMSEMKMSEDVDEVYNLAAQSSVAESFKNPSETFDVTAKGCINILQCLLDLKMKNVRFYQASSSEMFGKSFSSSFGGVIRDDLSLSKELDVILSNELCIKFFQHEDTKHSPVSPYGVAKCDAHMVVDICRNVYGLHASCGINYNIEGPKRGSQFVTRKITKWISDFLKWQKDNLPDYGVRLSKSWSTEDFINYCIDEETRDCVAFPKLRLGNLDSKRDFGHAKDYVRSMHLMLQQDEPDDYVICTGHKRSVRDFLNSAFNCVGISNWDEYVLVDPEFYRPVESTTVNGNCSRAREKLNWRPEYSFDNIVEEMVKYDIEKTDEKVQSSN